MKYRRALDRNLQDLALPAWVTVQILDAARPWSTLPLHNKWNLSGQRVTVSFAAWLFLLTRFFAVIASFAFPFFNASSIASNLSTIGLPVQSSAELVLTDAVAGQQGAAWFRDTVLVRGFRTEFTLNLSAINADHHDGVAFVIQSEGPFASGVGGAGLAYGDVNALPLRGITNSLAIEFDTFCDNATSGRDALQDPNANHVSVQTRGALANSADHRYSLQQSTAIPPLSGSVARVVVQFDPTASLLVFILPLTGPVINVSSSLVSLPTVAYVGFTASTSAASGERHAISDWSFAFSGRADATRTAASGAALTSAVAGVVESFDVQLVDQFGNDYPFDDGVVLSSNTPSVTIAYSGLGRFSVAYNFTVAGSATALNVTQNGVVVVSATPVVAPNVLDANRSLLQWTVASGATIVAGNAVGLVLVTRDRFGNRQLSGGAVVSVGGVAATDHGDGTYGASVPLTVAGATVIDVLVDGTALSPPLAVNVVPAALDAQRTTALQFDAWIASDLNGTVSIDARDAYGNLCSPADVALAFGFSSPTCSGTWLTGTVGVYDCPVAGIYTVDITAGAAPISGSPFQLQVSPATAVNASASRLAGWSPTMTAQRGASFSLTTFDFDGNQRDSPVAQLVVQCAPVPCVVHSYVGKGQYKIAANLTAAGALVWNVTVNGAQISGSPFLINVVPAAADAASCALASAAALNQSLSGKPISLELVVRDEFGNQVQSLPPLSAALDPPVAVVSITGTTLSFTVADSGAYRLTVRVGTAAIAGSPFSFVVAWAGLANEVVLAIGGGILLLVLLIGLIGWYVRAKGKARRDKYDTI
jgi:hypothetical protein